MRWSHAPGGWPPPLGTCCDFWEAKARPTAAGAPSDAGNRRAAAPFVISAASWSEPMWKNIESAPSDEDVILLVSDCCREPHEFLLPCRRAQAGWVIADTRMPLALLPLKWMSRGGNHHPIRLFSAPSTPQKPLHDPVSPPAQDPPAKPMHDPPAVLSEFGEGGIGGISAAESACRSNSCYSWKRQK
jgi:hypothetical protein